MVDDIPGHKKIVRSIYKRKFGHIADICADGYAVYFCFGRNLRQSGPANVKGVDLEAYIRQGQGMPTDTVSKTQRPQCPGI